MTYITKESVYELLENFERLYPEAAAAFRVAAAEMPEGVVRCRNCAHFTTEIDGRPTPWCCYHEGITYAYDFCSDGRRKEGGAKPKLKPCPFCGGEAEVVEAEIEIIERDYWAKGRTFVSCTQCGAGMFGNEPSIEAWNRRANETDRC